MASRAQLVAVNRTIKQSGLPEDGAAALAIELARGMARKVDARGGIEGAPNDLVKAYLSAAKDLQRAVNSHVAATAPKRGRDAVEVQVSHPAPDPAQPPQLQLVEEGPLARYRREQAEEAARWQGATG